MKLFTGKGALLIAAILGLQQLSAGVPVDNNQESLESVVRRGRIPSPRPGPRPGIDPIPPPRPGSSGGHPAPGSAPGIPNLPDVPRLGWGNGVGDIHPIATYETKGKQRLNAYQNAVDSKKPDTKVVDNEAQVVGVDSFFNIRKKTEFYKIDEDTMKNMDGKAFPELQLFRKEDLGIDPNGITRMHEITIRPPRDFQNTISRGSYDIQGRFIVAEEAFKKNDKTPNDSKQKTPLNEVTWQSFASVAQKEGKSMTNNLKVIFLMNIQNKGFWGIAGQNYKEAGISTDKMHVWQPGTAAETARFERFLGSDNINGKLLFLANHHNSIGDKKIAKVITIPRGVPGSKNKFTAALVLE